MTNEDIEPLEPSVWLAQLRQLARCSPAEDAGLSACLLRSFHLAQLAPRPLRHIVGCDGSADHFEALLEAGATQPAIEALLGNRFGYCLRHRAIDSPAEAEVWFPDFSVLCRGRGHSAPAALYAAWLDCLLSLDPLEGPDIWPPMSPVLHRFRSEPHRKPTEH